MCHKREHHRRPGATRTRIDGLGHRCPDPLDDEPPDAAGVEPVRRFCGPPLARRVPRRVLGPIRTADLVVRNHARYPLRHEDIKVRREGLEPPCGMPDLQSGAVAAAPPTLGVTNQDRTGSLRDHGPALCRLSYSHRAQRRNRTSVPWEWTRCSSIELAEPACSRRDLNPQSLDS